MATNNDKKQLTNISELGEFGLINRITQNFRVMQSSTKKAVGDDAAVFDYGDEWAVVSSDMFTEGVHFDLVYTPLKHLGYKAIVASISDIFAMNAEARQVVINIGLSSKYTVEAVDEIYSGIWAACQQYGIDLAGGDTVASKSGLVISVTAFGSAVEEKLVYRNGAKNHDLLCVTGDLGGAFLGLQLLEREKRVFMENAAIQPELDGHDYILQRQLRPEARKDVVAMFKELKLKPTAMIDISDGLASDVMHICNASGVGCQIYEEKLPLDPSVVKFARELNIDPTVCALNGGEDYELLFTIDQQDHKKVEDNPDFTIIGFMDDAEDGASLITPSNQKHKITAQGWDAFRNDE